jgi:hypothetical protein
VTSPGAGFPAAPSKPFNPFERIQALAKAAETASPGFEPVAKKPEIETASLFGGSPLPPLAEPPPKPPIQSQDEIPFATATPAFAPAPASAFVSTSAAVPESGEVKLDLAAALKNCATHDLGSNPENIPSWVQFMLPYELISEQLSSGRVIVSLDAIVAGLDAPIRTLFAQARPGVKVELPSNVVFHAVSTMKSAAASSSSSPSSLPIRIPAPPNPPESSGAPPPVESRAESSATTSAPKEQISWESPASFLQTPEPVPAAVPKEPEPIFQSFLADPTPPSFTSPSPSQSEPVIIPANPVTGSPEFVSPPPVLPPSPATSFAPPPGSRQESPPPAPPPPQGSIAAVATPRSDHGARHLLLTVLLGSPEATDVASVVRLTRNLPGVAAAVCVKEGLSVAEAGDHSPDAQRFLRDAPRKVSGLTALASLTGIEDAETLHIQSGPVEATFCLQGTVTFAVLHDPRRREPMLKEKITLLGRELACLISESSAK